jgi:hypothetical protein
MKISRILFFFSCLVLLLIHNVNGQGAAPVILNPDCPVVSIGLTLTSGSGATLTVPGGNGFDNRAIGCQTYTLQYVATASSGSLTGVTFQAAGGAVTPGTFGAFPGTVSTGINPNTSNTGAISTFSTGCASSSACTVANSWLNVLVTRGTFVGTLQIVVYGWKSGSAKAGGGTGGGAVNSVAGTTNQIVCSPTTGNVVCGIATNPVIPGVATAAGFNSSESFSGSFSGSGLTSGQVVLSVADIAGTAIVYVWPSTNGTAGQVLSDSGVTTCPTLPAGYPTVCHLLAWIAAGGGGSGGGGVLGYSATALTLPTAGTTFLAPVGGALASTTEANVTANAPAAAAISNMYVSLSAAPGTGNTVAFTFRDAGSSTTLTCTISGATATSCNDVTHSFTPVVGDALAIQVVTTGTVIITPAAKIIVEYGVMGGGGGSGALTLISAQTLSSPAASVTFSAIPGTFTDLILSCTARSANSSQTSAFRIQFNTDTGANYFWSFVLGTNGGVSAGNASTDTSIFAGNMPAASTVASYAGNSVITISLYAGAFTKMLSSIDTALTNAIGGSNVQQITTSGYWNNTAAITSITVMTDMGNFVAGSVFELFGRS